MEDHKSQDAKGPGAEWEGHKVCGRGLWWADPEEWAGFSGTGRGAVRRAGVAQRRLCESGASWLGIFLKSGSLVVRCEPELRVPASGERRASMNSHREGRMIGK